MPRLDSAGGGGGGVVTAIEDATANELVTIHATTTALQAEDDFVIDAGKMGLGQDTPLNVLHVTGASGVSVEVARFDNGGGGTDGTAVSVGGSSINTGGFWKFDQATTRMGLGLHGADMSISLEGFDPGTNAHEKFLFQATQGSLALTNGLATFAMNGASRANLYIQNGTPPDALVSNACSFYSASGFMHVVDADGDDTQISPHNEEGEWEFFSRNIVTGKTVRCNMERMIKKLEEFTGETFIEYE